MLITGQVGSESPSFSREIAEIQQLMQQSGLKFQMHATGTTVEGSWEQVARVIGCAHTMLHQEGIPRIQTDVRIITRMDKIKPLEENIRTVQNILST
ncbi:hypothetical protein BJY00DRAFT_91306 [Aspergillus carlsbadensis]|nr:hypothetical protein BJY00DRAFT_91306 [Aspergillus carlsbadensis]